MMTEKEVMRFLNIQQSTLRIIEEAYCLFSIGEEKLYPSYQFTDKGLNAHVAIVSSAFRKINSSGDRIHEWFMTSLDELDGLSPLEHGFDEKVRMIASVHADIESL